METLLKDSFFPDNLIKDERNLTVFLDLIEDDIFIRETLYLQCSTCGFFGSFKLLDIRFRYEDELIRKAYELSIVFGKEKIHTYLYKKYRWIINGTKIY